MSSEDIKKLVEERSALLSELSALPHIVHGTVVERYTVCSRPNCKCRRGQRHGPILCVVVNENGKQRQKYIPKEMRELARLYVDEYQRALEIMDLISAINLQLLSGKSHA